MQNSETLLIVMVAIVGFLVLAQLLMMTAILFAVRKGMKVLSEDVGEFKTRALPVMDQSREVLENTRRIISRIEPKLEAAAADLAEMTRTASAEVKNIQASANEITERMRKQAARVDGMTTAALDNVDRVGRFLNSAVSLPVRRVSGVMAAAKAVVDVLRSPTPVRRAASPAAQSYPERERVAR